MAELFNHVLDRDYSQAHTWLLAWIRVGYAPLRIIGSPLELGTLVLPVPYVALLSLGGLPRVALLLHFVHHMHNTLVTPSYRSTYCILLTAYDERYEILLAFPLPTTQRYY